MTALTLATYELTKRFGAFTALDAVTLKVHPGTGVLALQETLRGRGKVLA
jgi:ABC-type branched-subunit amino acid transport system ATPase component